MRRLCCGSLAAMFGLMVTGCVQQRPAVDPVTAAAQLRTGAPLLHCRAECLAEWHRAQPDAAQLDAAGRWSELAALSRPPANGRWNGLFSWDEDCGGHRCRENRS